MRFLNSSPVSESISASWGRFADSAKPPLRGLASNPAGPLPQPPAYTALEDLGGESVSDIKKMSESQNRSSFVIWADTYNVSVAEAIGYWAIQALESADSVEMAFKILNYATDDELKLMFSDSVDSVSTYKKYQSLIRKIQDYRKPGSNDFLKLVGFGLLIFGSVVFVKRMGKKA